MSDATPTQITTLRGMLGESIPVDGAASDTLFTDDQVGDWVDATDNLNLAAVEGWKIKKASFANLVDVTDGAASRKLGDLMAHADSMIDMYTNLGLGVTAGRTRVGKIVRR